MTARQLQPGTRYRLPAKTHHGGHEIGVSVASFTRCVWSDVLDCHRYLFVACNGREVWLSLEDVENCVPERMQMQIAEIEELRVENERLKSEIAWVDILLENGDMK